MLAEGGRRVLQSLESGCGIYRFAEHLAWARSILPDNGGKLEIPFRAVCRGIPYLLPSD